MTTTLFTKKFAALVALAGLFMFSGVVMFQLEVAFGWTNPAANPPGGSGVLTAATTGGITRVGINTPAPATANLVITPNPPGGPAIDTDPTGATGGRIIGLSTTAPQFAALTASDAASKAYVDAQVAGAAGGGGGALVLYYKTNTNPVPPPPPAPTCPSGYTPLPWTGYGPHYLGILNYDWYQQGQYGNVGGGFPAIPGQDPPPAANSAYQLTSVAIGSDSVCAKDQTSVVPFSSIYVNTVTTGVASLQADACFTDPNTGFQECNRCIICQK